jgi:transposase
MHRELDPLGPSRNARRISPSWEEIGTGRSEFSFLTRDERGFHDGVTTVRDWVRTHLRRRVETPTSRPPPARPSARRAAWLLTAPSDRLNASEQRFVECVCDASRPLASAHQLALQFRTMLATHDPHRLGPWLNAAVRSEFRILAYGLRRDYDAVLAAILFRWSNGQVEGQVSRLKLVKRTMYGPASFPLLRRRVLAS